MFGEVARLFARHLARDSGGFLFTTNMAGYVKLFSEIVDSSIWEEDSDTCKVWITLLALADQDGYVRGSEGWLAGKSRVSLGKCVLALRKFKEPDLRSRTEDNEGRRIEQLEDGWLILNYISFRDRLSADPKVVASRERVRKHRELQALKRGDIPKNSADYEGYVYYMLEPEAVRMKIGYSSNPWARLAELKGKNPTLRIEGVERGSVIVEHKRHEEFKSIRMDGEWFKYTEELKAFVAALPNATTIPVGVTSPRPVVASEDASVLLEGKESEKGKPFDPMTVPEELKTSSFMDAWGKWINYRRGFRKVKDWAALFSEQLAFVSRYSAKDAEEILRTSMRNGWCGLFEPKETRGKINTPVDGRGNQATRISPDHSKGW